MANVGMILIRFVLILLRTHHPTPSQIDQGSRWVLAIWWRIALYLLHCTDGFINLFEVFWLYLI